MLIRFLDHSKPLLELRFRLTCCYFLHLRLASARIKWWLLLLPLHTFKLLLDGPFGLIPLLHQRFGLFLKASFCFRHLRLIILFQLPGNLCFLLLKRLFFPPEVLLLLSHFFRPEIQHLLHFAQFRHDRVVELQRLLVLVSLRAFLANACDLLA